jgi:putative ABC transport system permease protein
LVEGDEYAITVNESFYDDYPDLQLGDFIRLKIDGHEADWQIVGIFQFTGVDELFAYCTYEQLSQLMNSPGQANTYRLLMTDHSTEHQIEMSPYVDALFKDAGYHVKKVEPGNSVVERAMDYIAVLTNVLLLMALLTALVGSIGLAGTLSMNVLERTREIGVMRAIGAYNTIVSKLVIVEGLLIGLISYVLSAVFSFPITSFLANIVSRAIFNSPADFAFTLSGFFIWLLIVIVLSIVASIIPARNASQMTIREVLAYE